MHPIFILPIIASTTSSYSFSIPIPVWPPQCTWRHPPPSWPAPCPSAQTSWRRSWGSPRASGAAHPSQTSPSDTNGFRTLHINSSIRFQCKFWHSLKALHEMNNQSHECLKYSLLLCTHCCSNTPPSLLSGEILLPPSFVIDRQNASSTRRGGINNKEGG
jgi:hypothetical protein